MKKVLLLVLALGTFSVLAISKSYVPIEEKNPIESQKTEFDEGFEDGYCEGWKDVKGQYAICPITPIPPIPEIGQSSSSYRDGYNTGFKAGMRAAHRN